MGMFFLYLDLCAPHTCLVHVESEEGFGFPGTGLVDGCEPLQGCWERKLTSARAASAPKCWALPSTYKVVCFLIADPLQRHFLAAAIFARRPSFSTANCGSPSARHYFIKQSSFWNYSSLLNDAIEFPFYSLTCFLLLCPQLPCVS